MSTKPRSKNIINNQPIHPMDFLHTILELHKSDKLIHFNLISRSSFGDSLLNISNLNDIYQNVLNNRHYPTIPLQINSIIFRYDNQIYLLQNPIITNVVAIDTENDIQIQPIFTPIGFTHDYLKNQLENLQTQITNLHEKPVYIAN